MAGTESSLVFTPLYGTLSETGAICYLLEIDDVKLLLDIGWDQKFDIALLEPLRAVAPEIDLVLISHPDIEHIGALPYAVREFSLKAPVYCTSPVCRMGYECLLDAWHARSLVQPFSLFSEEDISAAFKLCKDLKYSQTVTIKKDEGPDGSGNFAELTPYASGRLFGGALWRIKREPDDIVYAVDFNHKKDEHLNGAAFDRLKPTLLITDAFNTKWTHSTRRHREKKLKSEVMNTLRENGSVLLPVDCGGRLLELLLILDKYWRIEKLSYPLVLLTHSPQFSSVLEYVKSNLEWMTDIMSMQFNHSRKNPFELSNVRIVQSMAAMENIRGPKVVLCSTGSLEAGFSRDLLFRWAHHRQNHVMLTDRGSTGGTLARTLYELSSTHGKERALKLKRLERVSLSGKELESWNESRRHKAEEAELVKQRELRDKAMRDIGITPESADISNVVAASLMADRDNCEGTDTHNSERSAVASNLGSVRRQTAGNVTSAGAKGVTGLYEGMRHRIMFTTVDPDKKKTWGEYGEDIDDLMYCGPSEAAKIREQGGSGSGAEADTVMHDSSSCVADERVGSTSKTGVNLSKGGSDIAMNGGEGQGIEEHPPTKVVENEYVLNFLCKLSYIDFEGRSDGRSMVEIIRKLMTKNSKLLLVHGTPDSTMALQATCQQREYGRVVLAPHDGECLDITSDTSVLRMNLAEGFDDACTNRFFSDPHEVGDYEVTYLEGSVVVPEGDAHAPRKRTLPLLQPLAPLSFEKELNGVKLNDLSTKSSVSGAMEVENESTAFELKGSDWRTRAYPPMLVAKGELNLVVIKDLLQKKGLEAEFNDGVLVCSRGVTVFKPHGSKLQVSGPLCDEFYTIRSTVYGQFSLV